MSTQVTLMCSVRGCSCRSLSSRTNRRRVVEGMRLPDDRSLTPNERRWIELLRDLVGDGDPPVTLQTIEALRRVLVMR